jgi:hypothetical protein
MCRCLGGCSHAMSNNEERAWEQWETETLDLVGDLRTLNLRLTAAVEMRDSQEIIEALQMADAISEMLFKLRHGPEQPV